jgi:hypothetical protein
MIEELAQRPYRRMHHLVRGFVETFTMRVRACHEIADALAIVREVTVMEEWRHVAGVCNDARRMKGSRERASRP